MPIRFEDYHAHLVEVTEGLSELDCQFRELERQRAAIAHQRKRIEERKESWQKNLTP